MPTILITALKAITRRKMSGLLPQIYLASRSPRRREILTQLGVKFEMLMLRERPPRGADVDESPLPGELPDAYVRRICLEKSHLAWQRILQRKLPRMPVLTADTTVCLGDAIFGKPVDDEDAKRMISSLSGTTHRVLSAVAIVLDDKTELKVNETEVRFAALSANTISDYIATGESSGKAGAYAIQGRAAAFIQIGRAHV